MAIELIGERGINYLLVGYFFCINDGTTIPVITDTAGNLRTFNRTCLRCGNWMEMLKLP